MKRHKRPPEIPQRCSFCGCSEGDACLVHGVPCCWVEYDEGFICSSCAPIEFIAASPTGRKWLELVLTNAALGTHPAMVACQALQEEQRQWEREKAKRQGARTPPFRP